MHKNNFPVESKKDLKRMRKVKVHSRIKSASWFKRYFIAITITATITIIICVILTSHSKDLFTVWALVWGVTKEHHAIALNFLTSSKFYNPRRFYNPRLHLKVRPSAIKWPDTIAIAFVGKTCRWVCLWVGLKTKMKVKE